MDYSNKTILIVEDELPFQEIYRDILVSKGLNVIVSDSGEEALEKLNTTIPDAILLDVIMPGLSGLDVLEHIRNTIRTKDIPVLVYSVLSDKEQIDRALSMGANDYAIKGETPAVDVLSKTLALLTEPEETTPDELA